MSALYTLTLLLASVSILVSAPPDFTKGDAIPEGATHDWNLGATGARGWIYSDKMVTTDARQIRITQVAVGSPADGVLEIGDVILGSANKPFSYDPRTEMGKALTEAERQGVLSLIRWREGEMTTVQLNLPVLGSYHGETAPYHCEKSKRILEQGCQVLASRIGQPSYQENPIPRSLNALALLASGNADYLPLVEQEAKWAADFETDGFKTWYYGYVMLFLAEYVLATEDDAVLPGLRRLALLAANGQSKVGSWGHNFANDDGRLGGYGMMNSPGIPLTLSLAMARAAGVKDPEVAQAIQRSTQLLRFYIGKGAVPYGDHSPWIENHEDNGKCGMAAVMFNLLNDAEGAEFFSRMSLASHGSERDTGHTGNFFNLLWSLPSVAQSGPLASGAWMNEFGAWYFDLARNWDGTFTHQGPPTSKRGDAYAKWDCTGAYLLSYAMPLRKIYLTGKRKSIVPPLDATTAQSLIEDGRGWDNKDRKSAYDAMNTAELLARLTSWSPIVRERAAMALGRRDENVVGDLIRLLERPDLYSRYGACQALKRQGRKAESAVPALVKAFDSEDLWLRILTAQALAGIGESAKVAAPKLLMKLAAKGQANDPRNMEQRYLSFALFDRREGLLRGSLEGVDRDLLYQAVRAGLLNDDGRARGSFRSVYQNLSYEEIKPLLPAIYQAIVEPAPSGIMFADTICMAGLELFANYQINEGIELLVDYARHQKQHASEHRLVDVMKMLLTYGAHGKRVIPKLERVADYFENDEKDFPKRLSLGKAKLVRETIKTIEASTDEPKLIHLKDD